MGGESFAEEARTYLSERWDCPVYNTYGSTEGTMCGECTVQDGLHVPEDMVHLDLYDPALQAFVPDGAEGRIVLSHLLPVGGRSGMVLLNYDSEDVTSIVSRERCACGRTHLRIRPPGRENDRVAIGMARLDRTEIERAVFAPENMADLTGEYEAFLYTRATRVQSSGSGSSAGTPAPAIAGRSRTGWSRRSPLTTRCSTRCRQAASSACSSRSRGQGVSSSSRSRAGRSGSWTGADRSWYGAKTFSGRGAQRTSHDSGRRPRAVATTDGGT